jgi:origin recognition complex subunit 3
MESLNSGIFLYCDDDDDALVDRVELESVDGEERRRMELEAGKESAWQQCQEAWQRMYSCVGSLQRDEQHQLIQDICTFLARRKNGADARAECRGCAESARLEVVVEAIDVAPLKTALVCAGMNIGDHGVFFANLSAQLTRSGALVVELLSKDCKSLRDIERQFVAGFHGRRQNALDDDDDDEMDKEARRLTDVARLYRCTSITCDPVVVLMPDVERFVSAAVSDFVSLCSLHRRTVPVVFVFGIATTADAVHSLLPGSVVAKMKLRQFALAPASHYLDVIVERLLVDGVDGVGFRLAPDTFRFMLDSFRDNNLSLHAWMRSLHLAMLQHFVETPPPHLTTLCCVSARGHVAGDRTSATSAALTMRLSRRQLGAMRSLPSIRQRLAALSKRGDRRLARRFFDDWEHCERTCAQWLADIDLYLQCFGTAFRCYRALFAAAGANYVDSLHQEYMYVLDAVEVYKRMKLCVSRLTVPAVGELVALWRQLIARAQLGDAAKARLGVELGQLDSVNGRTRALAWIGALAKRYLHRYTELPLHELFFGERRRALIEAFAASIRWSIIHGLDGPSYYLRCTDCCAELPSARPDVCIAYEYFRSTGRMINLRDWFDHFCETLQQGNRRKKRQRRRREIGSASGSSSDQHVDDDGDDNDDEVDDRLTADALQTRFMLVLDELKLLGFIRATNRKADHVQRALYDQVATLT